MNTHAQTTLYEAERKWLFAACTCLVAAVTLYMYFLSASVHHVVMRKEIDKEISGHSSSVSMLEAEYIEAQHAVSEDIASMRGFALTDAKIYIDRSDTTLVLRTN
jgi:hypothetical protein